MIIRVYNENGEIKVTKVVGDSEIFMFENIKAGQFAEIKIESSISYHAFLESVNLGNYQP